MLGSWDFGGGIVLLKPTQARGHSSSTFDVLVHVNYALLSPPRYK